jgi:diguanylate cyclase (GGDEF)-like protein
LNRPKTADVDEDAAAIPGKRLLRGQLSTWREGAGDIMVPRQAERLLAYLKDSPLLDGYCLSIYHLDGKLIPDKSSRCLCDTLGIAHLCPEICLPSLHVAVEDALRSRSPVFFRCPLGLFSFAVPLSADSCLVGGGVRENLFDLYFCESEQFDLTNGRQKALPYEILEQLEKLPVSTEKSVRETMLKVERLIKSFSPGERVQAADADAKMQSTITNVAAAIGKTKSYDEAIGLFSETLGILLDIPAIALVLKDAESNCCHLESCWGVFSGPAYLALEALPFHDKEYLPTILTGDEVTALFPGGGMTSAICLPLLDNGDFFGMAVLFNVSLTSQDISLVGLLTAKLVGKLKEKLINQEMRRKHRDIRLLEMIRTLALTESQEDLLRLMMEMAAELVDAANGSLMLIDKSGKVLRIAAALGINPALAQSLYTRMDEGIAGRVAASGAPILIKDIEQEQHWGRQNRIRFVTKSCISLPLRFKGKTIGVLNLADKKNNAPFSADDQDVLTTFIDQAMVILVRTTSLRRAKQNSVTDPATGLYNPSYVKKRLNEELSRSIRYNLPLTLIIASLDNGDNDGNQANSERHVKEMAGLLNASLRDIDLVGRFSEKEFCIILPSTPMKDSLHVVERIKRSINKELTNKDDPPNRELSVGIASFPENGGSSGDMITAARAALAKAEAEGGM